MDWGETPFSEEKAKQPVVDMQQIVGSHDLLFVCLDTLRYDVAKAEEEAGRTPVLSQFGPWEKRQAAGKFT